MKIKTDIWVLWAKKNNNAYGLAIHSNKDGFVEFDFEGHHYFSGGVSSSPEKLKEDFPDYDFGYDRVPIEFEV